MQSNQITVVCPCCGHEIVLDVQLNPAVAADAETLAQSGYYFGVEGGE